MDIHEWLCCKKSARRKKRLVKTDRDKQLIQMDKQLDKLREQKQLLPKVPLEHPYQRGWKRFFVIDNNYLWPRIHRLTSGRSYRLKDKFNERFKYINNIKNIPRNSPKETYLELET